MAADPTCATCHGTGVIESEDWHDVDYHDCPACGRNMALHPCFCDDPEPQTVTLTIPGTPAYSLSPNARCHWAVKRTDGERLRWGVKKANEDRGRHSLYMGPVRLHWTVYLERGGKRRDLDNVLSCLKPAQDQLVQEGIIGGDSPRWIPTTPTVEQITWSKHKGEPKIVVVIEEVQP